MSDDALSILIFGGFFLAVVGGLVLLAACEEKAFAWVERLRGWEGGRKAIAWIRPRKAKVIDLDSARLMKRLRDEAGGLSKESLGVVPKVSTKKRDLKERH